MLTENSDGVPGKMDLYLENEDFPCDDGIYYFPTPPTKRFVYDLDQLSGGEKSLASLALQYSIAMASKSPFLMLDEIDAFLDAANVLKFVNLVNESIRGKIIATQTSLSNSSWLPTSAVSSSAPNLSSEWPNLKQALSPRPTLFCWLFLTVSRRTSHDPSISISSMPHYNQ